MTDLFLEEHLRWIQFCLLLSNSFMNDGKWWNKVINNACCVKMADLLLLYGRYVFSELFTEIYNLASNLYYRQYLTWSWSFNQFECLRISCIEWDNESNTFIYSLERTSIELYTENHIYSHVKGNEAPQDKLPICWTKLPSLSTHDWSADAESFVGEVLRELIVPLRAIYIHTNGACMEMNKAFTVDFCQKWLCRIVIRVLLLLWN